MSGDSPVPGHRQTQFPTAPSDRENTSCARSVHRIPLLHDWHTHPMLYSAFLEAIDLQQIDRSPQEVRNAIADQASTAPGAWTIAYGWDPHAIPLETLALDRIPHPVVLLHRSLHGVAINRAGRPWLEKRDPQAASSIDDPHWVEENLRRVLNLFVLPGASSDRLRNFYQRMAMEHGIWQADEMLLVDPDELRLFEEAGLSDRSLFWAAPETFQAMPHHQQKQVDGLKIFADGAIGTRTAALHPPYLDSSPPQRGQLLLTAQQIAHYAIMATQSQKPLAIHAIGDRAIDEVIEAATRVRVLDIHPSIRIEHAQLISQPAAHRAKALGIHLCMQPNFSSDSVDYQDRLPRELLERNNDFRMLIDSAGYRPGFDLFFGSDGMPHGAKSALSQSLFPPLASQKLSLEEFQLGYCHPDLTPGWIDLAIDWTRQLVETAPTIRQQAR
ncbi:MAG: amidohydrolase family protein [Pirellulaceae bacterium]